MAISKTRDNQYSVRVGYSLAPGSYKRLSKKVKKYAEAKEVEKEMISFAKKDSTIYFKDFARIYLEDYKARHKYSTYSITKYIIDGIIFPFFKDFQLNKITPSDIHTWQLTILNRGVAKTTLTGYENLLKRMMDYAMAYYKLPENPCRRAELTRRYENKEMNFWTVDEFKRVLSLINIDTPEKYTFKVLVYISFFCGTRIGESLALTRGDVNISNGVISINKTYSVNRGKVCVTPPKTKSAIRTIVIPSFLRKLLKKYFKAFDFKRSDRIFSNLTRAKASYMLKRYAKLAGVNSIRFHDLRHSAVSYWIHLGVPIYDISRRCGHRTPAITCRVYSHMYPKTDENIALLLQKVGGK